MNDNGLLATKLKMAADNNTPLPNLLLLVAEDNPEITAAVFKRKKVDNKILIVAARSSNQVTRLNLSMRKELPVSVLKTLAKDPHPVCRSNVALCDNVPASVFKTLAMDKDTAVRVACAYTKHITNDKELLSKYITSCNVFVRAAIASNVYLNESELLAITKVPLTYLICSAILTNPNCTYKVASEILKKYVSNPLREKELHTHIKCLNVMRNAP